MSLHTRQYQAPLDAARDAGKTFVITEMPAAQAEFWAFRAAHAALPSLIKVAASASALEQSPSLAAVAEVGIEIFSHMPPDSSFALSEELMQCVQFQPQGSIPRKLVGSDIEEVATRFRLKYEAFDLHKSLFIAAARSIFPAFFPAAPANVTDSKAV